MDLGLNVLLRGLGLPIDTTLLLRHSDNRAKQRLFDAAMSGDPAFDDYQRRQVTAKAIAAFDVATHLVGFVVDGRGRTVMAGIWELAGRSDENYPDPLVPASTGEVVRFYHTRRMPVGEALRGRLVVEWGKGYLSWHQRAANQDKPIVELLREAAAPALCV